MRIQRVKSRHEFAKLTYLIYFYTPIQQSTPSNFSLNNIKSKQQEAEPWCNSVGYRIYPLLNSATAHYFTAGPTVSDQRKWAGKKGPNSLLHKRYYSISHNHENKGKKERKRLDVLNRYQTHNERTITITI